MTGVEVQRARSGLRCPPVRRLRTWAQAALARCGRTGEISVRVVEEPEMSELNERYRNKPGPTNVLSFPFEGMPGVAPGFLGDIVVCAPVLEHEARAQGKTLEAHWAHLVVHGTLHLLGYDHVSSAQARVMESAEREILAGLGFPDPYLERAPA